MSRPTAMRPRLELLHVGAADRVGAGLVELVGVDPSDVVGLEDLRVEHARMLLARNRRNPFRAAGVRPS